MKNFSQPIAIMFLLAIIPAPAPAQSLSFVYPEEMTCIDLIQTNWKDAQQATKGMLAFQWAAGYFAASQHVQQDKDHFESLLTVINSKLSTYCKSNLQTSIYVAIRALSPSHDANQSTEVLPKPRYQLEVVMGRDGRPIVLYSDGAWDFANDAVSQENKIIIRVTEAKAHFDSSKDTDNFGNALYRYYFGCTYSADATNNTKYKFNMYAFTLDSELSNTDSKNTFSKQKATFHVMGGLINPGGRLSVGQDTIWYKIQTKQTMDDPTILMYKERFGCRSQQAAGLYATDSFAWKIGIFEPDANIKEEHVLSFMGTAQGVVALKSKF